MIWLESVKGGIDIIGAKNKALSRELYVFFKKHLFFRDRELLNLRKTLKRSNSDGCSPLKEQEVAAALERAGNKIRKKHPKIAAEIDEIRRMYKEDVYIL